MTEQPIGVSMSELAKDVCDSGFMFRQEQRQEDEIKRLAKEREDKKKAALDEDYAAKTLSPTGIKSMDDFNLRIISQAQDQLLELHKKSCLDKVYLQKTF